MSDLKVDGIIASTGTNTNLTLEGKGTGGVKFTDYLIQTKGADIGSATSLTLGKDGNQFDVTGTTTITSIATQGIGSYVTLHVDGALTFTHHSTNLVLPGAANITTAAGDIAVMYEYASADWRCVSYTKASGAAVVASSAGITLLETLTSSGAATSTLSATAIFDGTYDRIMIEISGWDMVTDNDELHITVSDDGGSSFESANYMYHAHQSHANQSTYAGINSASAATMFVTDDVGNASDESLSLRIMITQPD